MVIDLWFAKLIFFLSSALPSFLPSALPSFLSSALSSFLSSALPSFLSSALPSFLSSALPSFLSSALPSFLPFSLPSFLPFLPSFLLSFLGSQTAPPSSSVFFLRVGGLGMHERADQLEGVLARFAHVIVAVVQMQQQADQVGVDLQIENTETRHGTIRK